MTKLPHNRTFIMGATGLLGTTLATSLADAELLLHGHTGGNCQYRCDLRDAESVFRLIAETAPTTIINLAACTNVDLCQTSPIKAWELNCRVVENIAAAIKQHGRKETFLIHISTDQVYDGKGPHREEEASPANTYALSKYAGELAAASVPSAVLRTNFFGPSQLAGRQSFSDWIISSLHQHKEITAFTDVSFNPLTMATLARVIRHIARRRIPGIYNVGSHQPMSKAEFIYAVAEHLGLQTGTITSGSCDTARLAAYRPKDMTMDCSLFEQTYDFTLPKLREEITRLTLNEILK